MKKMKIKYTNILIFLLLIIVIIMTIISLIGRSKKNFKIVVEKLDIKVGEEFVNDFKAYYKNVDVTDNVKVEANINNKLAGNYEVNYLYKKGEKEFKITKKVRVIDDVAPEITLKGGNNIVSIIDKEFHDPGYVALDNSDGDITNNVEVNGTVDIKTEGEYTISYKVKDKSGNVAEVQRKITITKDSPLIMSVKDFTLDGLFDGVTLKESTDGGKEYIDSIIFAGDSMALYYVINEQISGKNLWHQISITPETALTSPIYINHQDTKKTFVENFEKYKPEMVIMTLGTNSAAYMTAEYFYEKYTELITEIKKVSPKTKIIIQSIPPVDGSFDENTSGISNDKINKLNYYIGKMCEELNVKFLNSAPIMKDENGACKKGFCSSDGIHPTKEGQEALIEFARTHMYID